MLILYKFFKNIEDEVMLFNLEALYYHDTETR